MLHASDLAFGMLTIPKQSHMPWQVSVAVVAPHCIVQSSCANLALETGSDYGPGVVHGSGGRHQQHARVVRRQRGPVMRAASLLRL